MKRFLAILLMLPVLAACQQAPAAGGSYSTGGDPDDDPCARVVSAIGYADLLLKPAGEEDAQHFEDAVLGRLAEVRGITLQFGPRLPGSLGGAVRTVESTTEGLSKADVPRSRQVSLLKEYRAAAGRIERACD
ncbi:hypothetical protein [Nonomuraea sp. NPDC048826]|uniref:hypothetical protein n=1 Tax=Nonomuraea sp. NPDC048826 TaxID=3364347 RepID=UPI0037166FA0